MKLAYTICFCLLFGFNCQATFWYKDLEYIAIENFKVASDDKRTVISFDYIIRNPNWYNITIKPSILNLTIADKNCGEVMILDKINIKRKTKAAYRFNLVGNSSLFLQSGLNSILKMISDNFIDFRLYGDLKAGIFSLTKKWEMDYTYKMTWLEFKSFF